MPGSSSENSCVSCAMQRKELATMLASMVEGEPHYASTVKLFSKNRIEKYLKLIYSEKATKFLKSHFL